MRTILTILLLAFVIQGAAQQLDADIDADALASVREQRAAEEARA